MSMSEWISPQPLFRYTSSRGTAGLYRSSQASVPAPVINSPAQVMSTATRFVARFELSTKHAVGDLVLSAGQLIPQDLATRKSPAQPDAVRYRAFLASGRSDISARLEEIIYGPAPDQDE